MRTERTTAHWGSYLIERSKEGVRLVPDGEDRQPAKIGEGWLSGTRNEALRILHPCVRKGWLDGDHGRARCDDSYVRVGWEQATSLVADEIARVRERHGNGAIYGGSYGWASAGRFHHAQSQLRRLLNLVGGYVSARDTYSHAAAEVLLPHICGMTNRQFQDQMTSWPLIADHCSLLLAFGGIAGRTAQINSGGTSEHEVEYWLNRGAANGMEIINISPQRSDMDETPSARWLSIRPGSDTALMLALAHEIERNGWHDPGFLETYTSGWPAFRDYLVGETDGVPKSAEWAAPLCTIKADTIRMLARKMASSKTMIAVNWGMQRADHGEQPLWAGLALAAMLGQIGRPGTGFGFGYGSVTSVGRPKRLIAWPSMPQGRNPVADFVPVARVADMLLSPGETYDYNGEQRRYPDIRLVYWAGGNPFHHVQDLNRFSDAWTRPETVIVHDHSWTATARRADIVLPATTALEREDINVNRRDPALIYMSAVFPPLADARDDHDILAEIADRLGVKQAFTENRDKEAWLRWLWHGCRDEAQRAGFELPDFDGFRAAGRVDVPNADEHRVQFKDFVSDPVTHALKTDSGKITLFNQTIADLGHDDCPGYPSWLEPREWLGAAEEDELQLLSGQPHARLHSQLDGGSLSVSHKVDQRDPCYLHPDTAKRFGIANGDIVRLYNQRGACLAGARLTESIRRDCICLETGAWYDPQIVDGQRLEVHGNPNVLTIDKGASPLSQGNISHTTLVRVEVWRGSVPDLTVHSPPRIDEETGI